MANTKHILKNGVLVIMGGMLCAQYAYADIWQCVDKETGAKRYTNIPTQAKGCRPMTLHNVKTSLDSADASASSTTSSKPQRQAMATPTNFPSVDKDTQRRRDDARRRILEQELAEEQRLLSEAQSNAQGKFGDHAVELHQENIENLRKEIASIK